MTAELEQPDTPIPGFPGKATASVIEVTLTPDAGTRTWLIVAEAIGSLGWLGFSALVALFLIQVARRIPFAPRMPQLLMTAAFVLIISSGVRMFASSSATAGIATQLKIDYASSIDLVQLFLMPILIMTLALVLGSGRRIQKDTEGLV